MKRVLIVDDAAAIRHLLKAHLAALAPHVQTDEADTSAEGLRRFFEGDHDLTFLDGVFKDGTSSTHILGKMLEARPEARVVLTTSRPRDHPDVMEALGIGAYAYLAKPLQRHEVEEILQRIESDRGGFGRIR